MADSLEIKIGYESSEYVFLTVTGWSVDICWWLDCEVSVFLGTFTATVAGEMLTFDELQSFQDSLEQLYATLHGKAALYSIDDWIELELTGNGLGGVSLRGHIRDTRRNQLTFHFDLDQTFLPKIIAQIKSVLNAIRNQRGGSRSLTA